MLVGTRIVKKAQGPAWEVVEAEDCLIFSDKNTLNQPANLCPAQVFPTNLSNAIRISATTSLHKSTCTSKHKPTRASFITCP